MSEPKHPIALITDSTCNIPAGLVEQYDLIVQPQYVIWGTEELLDQVEIDTQTFYERLTTDPVHPKSSQPTAQDFVRTIEELKQAGAEEAVIICLSNQLSGTLDSAYKAQEMVDIPVHVYDSLSAGMGLGWQVIAAARARKAGGDAGAMLAAAEKARATMAVTLAVDSLEFLHKGGRIGGAVKLLGTALNLKPQLYVDHTTGRIEPGEKTRTRKKALEYVYQTFFEQMDTTKPLHIAVMHIQAEADAEHIATRIQEEYNPAELLTVEIWPVIGVHVGPGTVGITGYYDA